jgi:succinate dehydrogenase / fumarate reductase, cytochrome b subunit
MRIPSSYIMRKLHSLAGIVLVFFLIEHLITNSELALTENGYGFVKMVNFIHSLPYLRVIELMIIVTPLFVHAIWGVKYLLSGQSNAMVFSSSRVSLGQYEANHRYSWQRITAWLLLVLVFAHVFHMKVLRHPLHDVIDIDDHRYATFVQSDAGLVSLSGELDGNVHTMDSLKALRSSAIEADEQAWYDHVIDTAKDKIKNNDSRVVESSSAGVAALFTVREVFKSTTMKVIYTIFVISACFHAFNGIWTSGISWGITRSQSSQRVFYIVCAGLMSAALFGGLMAIWWSTDVNLSGLVE